MTRRVSPAELALALHLIQYRTNDDPILAVDLASACGHIGNTASLRRRARENVLALRNDPALHDWIGTHHTCTGGYFWNGIETQRQDWRWEHRNHGLLLLYNARKVQFDGDQALLFRRN